MCVGTAWVEWLSLSIAPLVSHRHSSQKSSLNRFSFLFFSVVPFGRESRDECTRRWVCNVLTCSFNILSLYWTVSLVCCWFGCRCCAIISINSNFFIHFVFFSTFFLRFFFLSVFFFSFHFSIGRCAISFFSFFTSSFENVFHFDRPTSLLLFFFFAFSPWQGAYARFHCCQTVYQ